MTPANMKRLGALEVIVEHLTGDLEDTVEALEAETEALRLERELADRLGDALARHQPTRNVMRATVSIGGIDANYVEVSGGCDFIAYHGKDAAALAAWRAARGGET